MEKPEFGMAEMGDWREYEAWGDSRQVWRRLTGFRNKRVNQIRSCAVSVSSHTLNLTLLAKDKLVSFDNHVLSSLGLVRLSTL